MSRLPVFSVHSILSMSNTLIRIQGRALDTIRIKSDIFDLNSNPSSIEEIWKENKQVSELNVMSEATITIKINAESFKVENLLYGDRANEYCQTITFEQAKNMAENFSRRDLLDYVEDSNISFLHEVTQEAECCWFFFYNPMIVIPKERWALQMLSAYAISKRGEISHTYNYLDDPIKAKDYLYAMSGYFKKRGL